MEGGGIGDAILPRRPVRGTEEVVYLCLWVEVHLVFWFEPNIVCAAS